MVNNKKRNISGSILIWSVMLGFVLTSVFFFFGMRQRATVTIQRDTAEILNARSYLESYADYLENLPSKVEIKADTFDQVINVNLTKKTKSIEDEIDFGMTKEYKFTDLDGIHVEWNACSDSDEKRGNLILDGTVHEIDELAICGDDDEFFDVVGPIPVTLPFILESPNRPFKYRITSSTNADVTDNTWHLDLSMDLDYGRIVEINRTFE